MPQSKSSCSLGWLTACAVTVQSTIPFDEFLLAVDYDELPISRLFRYSMHLPTGRITRRQLSPKAVEFPSCNPAYAGGQRFCRMAGVLLPISTETVPGTDSVICSMAAGWLKCASCSSRTSCLLGHARQTIRSLALNPLTGTQFAVLSAC